MVVAGIVCTVYFKISAKPAGINRNISTYYKGDNEKKVPVF